MNLLNLISSSDLNWPGEPTDNPGVEIFNGALRPECRDAHWFASLSEAEQGIEALRRKYNESQPHAALGHVPRAQLAAWDGASSVPGMFSKAGIHTAWMNQKWAAFTVLKRRK